MAREKIYLKPDDVRRLKDLESDIDWLGEEIRRAKLVGIDIADTEARFDKMKSIRSRMLEEYVK